MVGWGVLGGIALSAQYHQHTLGGLCQGGHSCLGMAGVQSHAGRSGDTHTYHVQWGGKGGEKGASLVQETPHHHHHRQRRAWPQQDLVGREVPAVPCTAPQPAPSTPGRLLALLSQQAIEMVPVRRFNPKVGENCRFFLFAFSKRRKKFSQQETLLLPVFTAPAARCAAPEECQPACACRHRLALCKH